MFSPTHIQESLNLRSKISNGQFQFSNSTKRIDHIFLFYLSIISSKIKLVSEKSSIGFYITIIYRSQLNIIIFKCSYVIIFKLVSFFERSINIVCQLPSSSTRPILQGSKRSLYSGALKNQKNNVFIKLIFHTNFRVGS